MPWVGLQCVVVLFPSHTRLHFESLWKVFLLQFVILIMVNRATIGPPVKRPNGSAVVVDSL